MFNCRYQICPPNKHTDNLPSNTRKLAIPMLIKKTIKKKCEAHEEKVGGKLS